MRTVWNRFTSTSNNFGCWISDTRYRKLYHFCFLFFSICALYSACCLLTTTISQAAVSLQITNFPKEIKINSEFILSASISGLPREIEAIVKLGVAGTTNYYGYGQIKNGDKFIGYNDTGSCDNAPRIKSDANGHWEGDLSGIVGVTAKPGDGKLRIKICDPDKTSNSYPITLTAMDPLPSPPEPAKQPEPDPIDETTVETHYNASLPDDSVKSSEISSQPSEYEPTTQTSPTRPTNPTNIKLPATFSAQAVPSVLGQSSAEATPEVSPKASTSSATAPKTNKYVIILGSLAIGGAVIAIIAFFLKSRPKLH